MRQLDGRTIAKTIAAEVTTACQTLQGQGTYATLAVVVPTDDEATAWYVRSIEKTATRVGIACRVIRLADATEDSIIAVLDELSADPSVHGIICQTPLPQGATLARIGHHIAVGKDIDGANPLSLGRLAAGLDCFAPATAAAVVEILKREQIPLSGARIAMIGRSTVVGKPCALLLLAENATVTMCHSRTRDLAEVCSSADIIVAAVGRAELVTNEYVKSGAVIIDVGTNPTADGGLVGDVDSVSVAASATALTPVPGGVGPVTTMLLMQHTISAAMNS